MDMVLHAVFNYGTCGTRENVSLFFKMWLLVVVRVMGGRALTESVIKGMSSDS